MRIAVLAITAGGNRLAATLARELPEADHLVCTAGQKIAERLSDAWGRYDGLVQQLGGKATPACGFAMGIERLVTLIRASGGAPAQ